MDHVWYFARDDQESGPFTEPQMKMLVAAGKVRQHDLVWKEGMSDWVTATEAPALAVAPVAPPPPPFQDESGAEPHDSRGSHVKHDSGPVSAGPQPTASRVTHESSRTLRSLSYLLIAVGFLGALACKGFESLAVRNVARLQAIVDLQRSDFAKTWDQQRAKLEAEQKEIREHGQFDAASRQRLNEIAQEVAQLTLSEHDKRQELERGLWREQRQSAEAAKQYDQVNAFWRQLVFLAAAAVFSAGLLAMGLIGEVAERAFSLLVLAVLAYSLFIGGTAWS